MFAAGILEGSLVEHVLSQAAVNIGIRRCAKRPARFCLNNKVLLRCDEPRLIIVSNRLRVVSPASGEEGSAGCRSSGAGQDPTPAKSPDTHSVPVAVHRTNSLGTAEVLDRRSTFENSPLLFVASGFHGIDVDREDDPARPAPVDLRIVDTRRHKAFVRQSAGDTDGPTP